MSPVIKLLRQGLFIGALSIGSAVIGISVSYYLNLPYPLNKIIAVLMSGAIFYISD